MPFSDAHPALRRALAARSYTEPTPVQAEVIAADKDRDLLVSAQTGSGKTVAFGLALAPRLLGELERFERPVAPRALIIAPTRELALQVHRELTWLYSETGARMTTCVGGMDPRQERYMLQQGVHFVIGTPGRLCDHLERGALNLKAIEAVVLDEADEMLDMGFREDLERLLEVMPPERRTLMFSATIPKGIATMAKKYQKTALRIAAAGEGDRHRDIEYHAVPVLPRERDIAVVNLLRYHDPPGALVFCQTRDAVTHLAANLNERGFSVAALSGELSQRERNQALQALRDGRARVCVATDVAARGLDLPDLGLVIHADLPQNGQILVHRSGRTGRAGKHGLAIVIVPDKARRFVERLLHGARIEASWRPAPSAEDIRVRDQDQLVLEIRGLADEVTDEDRAVAATLLVDRPAESLVAALVRLRRDARPAPEELTNVMQPASRRPLPRGAAQGFGPSRGFERDDRGPDRGPAVGFGPTRGDFPRDDRPARSNDGPARSSADRPDRGPSAPRAARTDEAAAAPVRKDRERRIEDTGNPDGPERRRTVKTKAEIEARTEAKFPRPTSSRGASAPIGQDAVWFTVNVGRSKNADPKWLIPLLCRRGNVTKKAIGKIQVLMRETRVQIAADAADEFAQAIQRPDEKDRNIHIDRVEE